VSATGDGGVLRLPVVTPPRDSAGRVDVDAIVHGLRPCDLLETAGPATGWSYVAAHDGFVLRDDGRRCVLDHPDGRRENLGSDPFGALDAVCERLGILPDVEADDDPDLPALTGGLVGAFSYDLARRVEQLPDLARSDRGHEHLHLRQADLVVAVSPDRSRAWVVGRDLSGRGELRVRAQRLVDRVSNAAPPVDSSAPGGQPASTSLPRDDYLAAVGRALEAIAAGDAFQINLSQRLTARWAGDVHALYRGLRTQSPAPYGAALEDIGLASISPETFLTVDGRLVATRPIKGTRPRSADPHLDAAHADDLVTSEKDRAENVMVVDLERNDLGRVCEPGSVQVPELLRLEGHPTVWHLVSTVSGRLRAGVGFGGLLRATFPCGSITGAPKVAAMMLIEELEPVRRSWYCGAVGFLSPGRARLSVAIRTATLLDDGRVDHGAGGGIVADSDPAAEHVESMDKAAAFLRTVGAGEVVP
jgi:para-aminobenzoate synthetase component I